MATPLSEVVSIIETLKSAETLFDSQDIPIQFAKLGVTQASIQLGVDYPVTITVITNPDGSKTTEGVIEVDLGDKEIYLCGLYAYRNFALKQHDALTQKAVNFKTINFAVSGLTERAKEAMRIVWWCDNEILKTLDALSQPLGNASQMRGEDE